MRLFLSFVLPEKIKEKIYNNFSWLENKEGIKFVEKENLHITLLFLGNCDFMLLNILNKIFHKIIPTYQKFTLNFSSLEFVPQNKPNLFWISYFPENKEIYKLILNLNLKLKNILSLDSRKKFIFHTTLARMKNDFSSEIYDYLQKNEFNLPSFEINKIALCESELSKNGAKYKVLEEYFLK